MADLINGELDLTTAGAQGAIEGALYIQEDSTFPTGTGVFDAFLGVQPYGSQAGDPVESGYNTDAVADALNADRLLDMKLGTHTNSLLLADVPMVTVDGVQYREFWLDLNEDQAKKGDASDSQISLNALKIFLTGDPNLTGFNASTVAGPGGAVTGALDFGGNAALVYNMDAQHDNWVALTTTHDTGSGHADLRVLIPNELFANARYADGGGPNVVLYSEFGGQGGATYRVNSGFEEWGLHGTGGGDILPPPPPSVTTTVTVTTQDVTENDMGVTFSFQLSNAPAAGYPASVTVTIGGAEYTVDLDATGYGTQFVVTEDRDVYIDPDSLTATVTAINGGNYEATSVAGATATAQIADVNDTTTVTVTTQDVTENDMGVTFSFQLSNAPAAGYPASVTVTIGGAEYTVDLDATGYGTQFVVTEDRDVYIDPDSLTATVTAINGGNYEATSVAGATATARIADVNDTTTITLNDVVVGANGKGTIVATVDNAVTGSDLVINLSNGATATILVGQTSAISTEFVVQGYSVIKVDGTAGGLFEALAATDTALQNPDFTIDKSVTSVTGGMGNIVDSAGDVINYKIVLINTGNVTLTNPNLTDTFERVALATIRVNDLVGDNDNLLEVGEQWAYTATHAVTLAEFKAHQTLTNVATADSDQTGPKSDDATVALQSVGGLTAGFWGQHFEAWDGGVATNKQGVIDTASLVASGVLTKTDVLTTTEKGVLLGDANGNGVTNVGENTLFVTLAAAQQIILSSDSANDTRQILMKQALAAQLNINNGDAQPRDLITKAVQWLKGAAPFQYGTNSTGDVDANNDNRVDASDYNTTSKAFLQDANGSLSGTALTSNLNAWQTKVDVDATSWNVQANGEGLKNALMYFNQNQLVTTSTGDVAFTNDHITVMGQQSNVADAFWHTLDVASPDIKGIGAV